MKNVLAIVFLINSFCALGCICEPENLYLEFHKTDNVLIGRVVSINDLQNPDPLLSSSNKEYYKTGGYDVQIQITDQFKGTISLKTIRLVNPKSASPSCKRLFKQNEEYLIFGKLISDSELEFSTCSRSGLIRQKIADIKGIKEILLKNYAPFELKAEKQLAPSDSFADFTLLKLLNSDSAVLRVVKIPYLFKQNFVLQEVSNCNLKNVFKILIYKTEFDECPSTVYQSIYIVTYDGNIIELANYYMEANEETESSEYQDPPRVYLKKDGKYMPIAFNDDIYSSQISGSLDPDFRPYTNNDYQMFVHEGNGLIGIRWNGYELKKTTLKSIEEH